MEESNPECVREALSSLITSRYRIPSSDASQSLHLMNRYIKILQLENALEHLSIIHVAGTKGKGSTCALSEAILRSCGYKTGLFTSPHLIDVRERFRFNGIEVSEPLFKQYFWCCWYRLKEACNTLHIKMPSYFQFLTLMAFKMFTTEKVDVAILEVGLGGKYDPTNVITPDVCGITSLGFDHMEILGYTLPEIAVEKAGIFKPGVPAYSSPQREDALGVLKQRAADLNISLDVVKPLDNRMIKIGLDGDHQLINAALAVALCNAWIRKRGNPDILIKDDLPEAYKRGLANTQCMGRAQTERDTLENLTFYLDGAHSPESMQACAEWFCKLTTARESNQIMLFNCMPQRDPHLLFPPLIRTCKQHGVVMRKALFVSTNTTSDVSWQTSLQKCWNNYQNVRIVWLCHQLVRLYVLYEVLHATSLRCH